MMYETENKECRMHSRGNCTGLNRLECEGDITNELGKCKFYKDQETYMAERRHTRHRLKVAGLEHLLGRRAEK